MFDFAPHSAPAFHATTSAEDATFRDLAGLVGFPDWTGVPATAAEAARLADALEGARHPAALVARQLAADMVTADEAYNCVLRESMQVAELLDDGTQPMPTPPTDLDGWTYPRCPAEDGADD